jgi:hypothetical protein
MTVNKLAWTIGSAIGAQQALRAMRKLEMNDVLGTVGLERRRGASERVLPALGLITIGIAAGAVCALFLAPSSGRELRQRVTREIGEAKRRVGEGFEHGLQSLHASHGNGG